MISAASKFPQITEPFIESMFSHPFFQQKFFDLVNSPSNIKANSFSLQKNGQTSQLVEQITESLFQSLVSTHEELGRKFQEELKNLYQQIQKLKDLSYQNIGRSDYLARDFSDDTILEDQHIFDMPSIQRTISFLKDKVREISQNSTVMLESNEVSKELKDKEQFYIERLSSQLTKMEQKLTNQHQMLQDLMNKKIQKQQKTINNILETLNQLSGLEKKDRTAATLSSCKSATKLKNFFGFA